MKQGSFILPPLSFILSSTVRSHLQQIGVIHESAMLAGRLNFGDIQRLPPREEAIVLRTMHQTLVDHG